VKTIFNIFPNGDKCDLLLEAGNEDFSLLFYDKESKTVSGALLYELTYNVQPEIDAISSIENILNNNSHFIKKAGTVTILYNVNEATLIPIQYYDGYANEDYLNLIYGNTVNTQILTDEIEEKQIMNVYRAQNPMVLALNKFFPHAKYCHSGSLQLQLFAQRADTLHCIVYNRQIKVLFYKNGKLQLLQYYAYGTAADMLYCLLNVCAQYDVSPASVSLVLYGLIEQNSNLYKEIYNYFLNVEMASLPEAISLSEEIKQHPPHFFAHLIIPALCE